MAVVDRAYVDGILARLEQLPLDTQPQWGKMSVAEMVGHLRMVVLYTLGQGPEMPFKGNLKTRHIFRPLILNGIVAIPHNIRVPREKDGKAVKPMEASVEELRETLEEYLRRAEQGDLPTRVHPFFGPLSGREWRKFHVRHFTHHLKQFGA